LVNATMGHSRELDINDDRIAYKSSITVIPAALAVAEKVGKISGKDFITAVCLGVDFGIRLGLATNPKPVHARAIALGHSQPPRRAARFSAWTRMGCTTRSASPFAAPQFQGTARLRHP